MSCCAPGWRSSSSAGTSRVTTRSIDSELAAELRAIGTKRAEFCVDINAVVAQFCATETKLSGFDLPDPVTMAYAIDPLIATAARRLHLAVETESELTRGMVVMDLLEFTDQPPNALVVTAADRDRFLDMLRTAISLPGRRARRYPRPRGAHHRLRARVRRRRVRLVVLRRELHRRPGRARRAGRRQRRRQEHDPAHPRPASCEPDEGEFVARRHGAAR